MGEDPINLGFDCFLGRAHERFRLSFDDDDVAAKK